MRENTFSFKRSEKLFNELANDIVKATHTDFLLLCKGVFIIVIVLCGSS